MKYSRRVATCMKAGKIDATHRNHSFPTIGQWGKKGGGGENNRWRNLGLYRCAGGNRIFEVCFMTSHLKRNFTDGFNKRPTVEEGVATSNFNTEEGHPSPSPSQPFQGWEIVQCDTTTSSMRVCVCVLLVTSSSYKIVPVDEKLIKCNTDRRWESWCCMRAVRCLVKSCGKRYKKQDKLREEKERCRKNMSEERNYNIKTDRA